MTNTKSAAAYNADGKTTQVQFLQKLMRGTNVSLTAKEASDQYGIKCLAARMRDLKDNGFRVRTELTGNHSEISYKVSARDTSGSRKVRQTIPQTIYKKK
jgi:hypothetical protein